MQSINKINFKSTNKFYFKNNNPKDETTQAQNKFKNKDAKLAGTLLGLSILGASAIVAPKIIKKNKILNEIEKQITQKFSLPDYEFCCVTYNSPKDYIKAIKKANFHPTKFINVGGESVVVELKDGNILKLSHRKYKTSISDICAPEISRGEIKLKKDKSIFYLIQKKVNTGEITLKEFESLQEKAKEKGHILMDCMLDGGEIKQSNFGWYLNDKQERVPCIVDLGIL